MAKLAQNFAKYLIQARLEATGIVEKPDIIGAVFGQTEGLLGGDLDLRELQRTGRIGRIEVIVHSNRGRATADITIPSSLDASETALVAASLETIEKVGPCDAKIEVVKVEDVRTQKRRYVIERARDILMGLMEAVSDSQSLAEQIRQAVRTGEITQWNGLSCGPDVLKSDEIVIVEGRADVLNLLKSGIRNAIAIEGSKIPEQIVGLTKDKTVTVFLDGDRGGDLILKKLQAVGADIDFVARAETGKEVEELTQKQIFKALRERTPKDQAFQQLSNSHREHNQYAFEEKPEPTAIAARKTEYLKFLDQLVGTRAALLIDQDGRIMSKVPLGELGIVISDYPETHTLVIDGKINQDLIDLAMQRRIKCVVGSGYRETIHAPSDIAVLTAEDLRSAQ
ncbi:MAG: DNA primase DnaG [Candidatus Aenigmatarchaeota archaeon]